MNWRTNNSFVTSQGPCDQPGCKSSDAKTTYSDGHAWCFSCNHYFPASFRTPMGGPYDRPTPTSEAYPTRQKMSLVNCAQNYNWLKKYDLTDEEIDGNFFYAPISQRHVFAHTDEEGNHFYEARSVSPFSGGPKTISYGDKPTIFMGNVDSKVLVIVEDIVSAIKVGRFYRTMPLFGANLNPMQMAFIGRKLKPEKAVIWMDCNKYSVGMEYARQLGLLVPTVAIQTKEDPKAQDETAIILEVEDALDSMEIATNEG